MPINRDTRRAALLATGVAVPVVVVAAFALSALNGSSSPTSTPSGPVNVAAPPQATAQLANCTKVLEQLPVSLRGLHSRVVHTTPPTSNVVAWGSPAIILSCGVDRPKGLVPGSSMKDYTGGSASGPYYDVTRSGDADVFTTIDRAAYIAITIPRHYQGADYLPPLSADIAKALPAVCDGSGTAADPDKLCTRRK